MECVRVILWILPWVLVIASATFLALGLSWRHLTDSDTVNGAFLIASIVLAALAFVSLCVREMPEKKEEEKARDATGQTRATSARIPLVPVV